jgi:glycosyltransferase involved in cell wall biosynthesis
MNRKIRLGHFPPLAGPEQTGVADYAQALENLLSHRFDLLSYKAARVNLYHVGNNGLHREIYGRALSQPGIVILHDIVLQHLHLGMLQRDRYIKEFAYNYGEWSRGLAERLFDGRSKSAIEPAYFRYPMLRRLLESPNLVVVHSESARRRIQALGHPQPTIVVPHVRLPIEPIHPSEREQLRASWSIPPRGFVFGIFGHLRETKRIPSALRAFQRLRAVIPQAFLLIAGQPTSETFARALEPWMGTPGVIRYGSTSPRDFDRLCQSVDACINLRYPSAGETSGIAMRMSEAAKPVLVTSSKGEENMPGCIPIESGLAEESMLHDAMLWLATHPADALALGQLGREHLERQHSADAITAAFGHLIETAMGHRQERIA